MFVWGKVYKRRDLHERYGGQRRGGISTPSRHPFIMLFTGEAGLPYGYRDEWSDDGLFLYAGEGQRGHMSFIRGNRAVRDHVLDGKDLDLFQDITKGYVRYLGQMVCTGFQERCGLDIEGNDRCVIVFELVPIEEFKEMEVLDSDNSVWQEPLGVL